MENCVGTLSSQTEWSVWTIKISPQIDVKVRQNISYIMLSACNMERTVRHHTVWPACYCLYRRDCKCDASALLSDLPQQNTGKSSPLPYPALPTDLHTPSAMQKWCTVLQAYSDSSALVSWERWSVIYGEQRLKGCDDLSQWGWSIWMLAGQVYVGSKYYFLEMSLLG